MFIDAHAHIFPQVRGLIGAGPTRSLGYGRIAIGAEETQLFPPYGEKTAFTPEMLVANLDWAGVERAVLLQGTFYGECNQYVLEALERYPERLIGAAWLDPWAPRSRAQFGSIVAHPGFRALKLECSEATGLCGLHPEARLNAPELEWLWEEVEAAGWTLVLDLGAVGSRSYQTAAVRSIAQARPDLRIVIAHLGQPRPQVEDDLKLWRLWIEQIDLGRLPNVYFDTASLPAYVPGEDFPYPTAARYLRQAINRIGPAKVLWGTDQPGLLSHLNYPQLVKLAQLHTQFLSTREREMVLGGNALKVYGGHP